MFKLIKTLAFSLALILAPSNVALADETKSKKAEPTSSPTLTSAPVSNWISPASSLNAVQGSEMILKLSYATSIETTLNVRGEIGKKFLNVVGSNPTASIQVFIGQNITVLNSADVSALPLGTKVLKIRANSIYLSAALTKSFSGNVKFSGIGAIDSINYLQLFAVPCTGSSLAPVPIYSFNSMSKKSEGVESSDRSGPVLTYKWKISKTQQIGCFNVAARLNLALASAISPLSISPSDLRNVSNINITARAKYEK